MLTSFSWEICGKKLTQIQAAIYESKQINEKFLLTSNLIEE